MMIYAAYHSVSRQTPEVVAICENHSVANLIARKLTGKRAHKFHIQELGPANYRQMKRVAWRIER